MIEFRLPSLGADMEDGTLLQWHVKPGDLVRRGQVVAVVDTSKAAVDVEIWRDGVVAELRVAPGDQVPVGAVLALLREPGEATAPEAAAAPVALNAAVASAATLATAAAATAPTPAAAPAHPPAPSPSLAAAGTSNRQPAMRRAIAAAMSRSKREIPHYYLAETIPLARSLDWLQQRNAALPITGRILPAALLLKAVALALQRVPQLNGFYQDGAFRPAPAVHAGVAVALRGGGLVAPALHDVAGKDLQTLMRELSDLVRRARAGSLRSSEMSDPTLTITNLGDQGVQSVFGVIYPPQVALVGFGRIAQRPWVETGELRALPLVEATLAADHRVSDGHQGALFLATLRDQLQQPQALDIAAPASGAPGQAP